MFTVLVIAGAAVLLLVGADASELLLLVETLGLLLALDGAPASLVAEDAAVLTI